MGVNGGVGVQPPNQQSSLLPDAMLHNSMSAQRYGYFSQVTATVLFWQVTGHDCHKVKICIKY